MKRINILLSALLMLSLVCCKRTEDEVIMPYSLKEVNSLMFALDERTTFENSNTMVVDIDGKDYLLGFDANQGHLNFYDLKSGRFAFKQTFEKGDGPNAIPMPMSMDFIARDSLLIYGYGQGLYLMNDSSVIANSFNAGMLSKEHGEPGEALILGSSRIRFLDKKVYFSTYSRGVHKNTLYEYDLESGGLEYNVPYPSGYDNLLVSYYNVWSTLNPNNHSAITSFSLEDSLHVYDLESGHIDKIYAGSRFFEKPSDSRIKNTLNSSSTNEDLKKATTTFHENAQYGPLLYNEDRDVYHRLCFFPLLRDDLLGGSYFRDFSIITVSTKGEVLAEDIVRNENGEYLVMYPEAVWFTYNGSVFIQKTNTDDEDQLLYSEFKLEKNDL